MGAFLQNYFIDQFELPFVSAASVFAFFGHVAGSYSLNAAPAPSRISCNFLMVHLARSLYDRICSLFNNVAIFLLRPSIFVRSSASTAVFSFFATGFLTGVFLAVDSGTVSTQFSTVLPNCC